MFQFAKQDVSVASMIADAHIIVKIILIILLVLSLISWAIFFEKLIRFKTIAFVSSRFEKKFWSGIMMEKFYDEIKNKAKHPMAKIFISAMQEWQLSNVQKNIKSLETVKESIKERIREAMNMAEDKVADGMRKGLSFLATVASTAPFIGLFGTVWGVMHSFQSITKSNNTSLAVVAPGIAEALFVTGLGLAVAVPAVVFYNIVSNKSNNLFTRFETFSSELYNILSRELDTLIIKNINYYASRSFNSNSIQRKKSVEDAQSAENDFDDSP